MPNAFPSASDISKKKYGATERKLKKMEDGEKKTLLLEELAIEKKETADAIQKIKDLRADKKTINATVKPQKDLVKKQDTKLKNIQNNTDKIAAYQNALKSDEEMYADAKPVMETYLDIFGNDFYAEVQNHRIDKEAFIYPMIAKLAREYNVPIVATNDAHMANREDLLKRVLLINASRISAPNPKWYPAQDGDSECYIKTGNEMAKMLSEILPEDVVEEAMKNIDTICDKCNVFIDPEIKHYPKFENAKELLRKRCEDGISKRYPNGMPQRYYEQMEYELGIIDKMGYNDYFCEVIDFIDFCKNSADNSIEIGPGRGSGAGSIVCFLTEITELDPMNYDLMFERFLNPDRVTMPDIDKDADVADLQAFAVTAE